MKDTYFYYNDTPGFFIVEKLFSLVLTLQSKEIVLSRMLKQPQNKPKLFLLIFIFSDYVHVALFNRLIHQYFLCYSLFYTHVLFYKKRPAPLLWWCWPLFYVYSFLMICLFMFLSAEKFILRVKIWVPYVVVVLLLELRPLITAYKI